MLYACGRGETGLACHEADPRAAAALGDALWLDLLAPDEAERAAVERHHPGALPHPRTVDELEATSRTYQDEGGALHLHTFFLLERDGRPTLETVAFTLTDGHLVSLRDVDLAPFRLLRRRLARRPHLPDAAGLLVELLEIALDALADRIEAGYAQLEAIGRLVLDPDGRRPEAAIDRLAQVEDVNGKVRLCLLDMQRALLFLLRRGPETAALRGRIRALLRDIESLLPHNGYLSDKTNFLMDAALGLINVAQNQIIKIFSIAAVVFLPPTLVASIYGMNFRHMPELDWPWGYPLALLAMLLSALAPYWFFKRKGWL